MLKVSIVKIFLMEGSVFLSNTTEKLKEAFKEGLSRDPEVLDGKTIQFAEGEYDFRDTSDLIINFFQNIPEGIVRVLIMSAGYSKDTFAVYVSDNIKCIYSAEEDVRESIRNKLGIETLASMGGNLFEGDPFFWTITL